MQRYRKVHTHDSTTRNRDRGDSARSRIERQELIQILSQNDAARPQADLKILNQQFWGDQTIAELRATQNTTLVDDLKTLTADFWPEEDSIEDFLAFRKQNNHPL